MTSWNRKPKRWAKSLLARAEIRAILYDDGQKARKFVIDWWKRQETRAEVQSAIADMLDKQLPEEPYDRQIFNQKCERAFEYVFGRFGKWREYSFRDP